MDNKRLLIAIAVSIAILLGFQALMPKRPTPPAQQAQTAAQTTASTAPAPSAPTPGASAPAAPAAAGSASLNPDALKAEQDAPRVAFTSARLQGSIDLLGAKLDDLVLRDYRETLDPKSPLVRLLEPRTGAQPYYVQFGWTAAPGSTVALPGNDTLWTQSGSLAPNSQLTLSWDNGGGLVFQIVFSVDADYMFTVEQKVINGSAAPVQLYPYSRIRRDYTPQVAGYTVLHEGLIAGLDGKLYDSNFLGVGNGDFSYNGVKSRAEKADGVALDEKDTTGWAGITDKYWLISLIADNAAPQDVAFRYIAGGSGAYQVDFLASNAQPTAPGASSSQKVRLFAGAKEVHLLDRYADQGGIKNFDKAVDFGIFYFLTKPFFFAIDWLNGYLGNFGLAILVFTLCLKLLFFPLANKSYSSMSKMKLLAPKIQAIKAQYKDDQQKQQQAMMALYKAEKVNPASGCLPMLIQIPIFFSLYKVIFVTIEMRQAPFFGWIKDLSVVDPTNVFNLFGLIPFDPGVYSHYLHLGAWPLIMGLTMFFQQKLNPPPPDPVQAKMFQFMPIIFTFMLANFPAGLVIYWSWNNTLTILQQSVIMRRTRMRVARAKG
jgi:YidC/Oxa1 family membrane protein insertase